MNYLSIEQVSLRFGDRLLFENISCYLNQGEKAALVAKNGTGKSSLLRLIKGEELPSGGKVMLHPKINIGYLPQDPELPNHLTVFEAVYHSQSPVIRAIAAYEAAMLAGDSEAMQKAMIEMDSLQAWDYEVRIRQILAKLKIDMPNKPVRELSGGQRKRVALAKVLIDHPDLLILDEPTNHLDLDMIEWLEAYLKQSQHTILLVSHDRYFLDGVADYILDLDETGLYKYTGDYAYYLQKKMEREEMNSASQEKARNLYRKELDWMRRQPQARTTKAKARIDRFFDLEKKAKRSGPSDELILDLQARRLGSKIVELHHVGKAYGSQVLLKDFDYKFKAGERVGLIGKNGMGKSTLLNMIAGLVEPDSGKVVLGDTLVLGYYQQAGMSFKSEKKVLEVIQDIAEYIPMNGGKKLSASQLLERFLFDPKKQQTLVSKLSGGEKRRLYLLTILMQNPNFLILDEPTNDLDILTLQVLEDFLIHFPGTVLVVSHDRYFMDKIVEHVFVLRGGGAVEDFPGNYSAWREAEDRRQAQGEQQPKLDKPKTQASGAQTQEWRKELNRLEKQLEKHEAEKIKIASAFERIAELKPEEIEDLSRQMKTLEEAIAEKELRWLELSEYLEQA